MVTLFQHIFSTYQACNVDNVESVNIASTLALYLVCIYDTELHSLL